MLEGDTHMRWNAPEDDALAKMISGVVNRDVEYHKNHVLALNSLKLIELIRNTK